MIDFSGLRTRQQKLSELGATLTITDLRMLTNEMIDYMQQLVAESVDADVPFVPSDPAANDTFAAEDSVVNLPWTLGHVIVHATASAEESAFLAAELARGVEFHGRSRSEIPWEQVTTIAECRDRLEESRRMRLASLDMWPNTPNYAVVRPVDFLGESIDARAQFILGLLHDDSHLEQIGEIVRQAQAAR